MSWRALREARRYVIRALGAELILLALGRRVGWLSPLVALVCVFFFRDPERPPCTEPDVLYAPADGIVTEVAHVDDPWLGGEAVRISTFLSLLDVHVTRSPIGGLIAMEQDLTGRALPAFMRRSEANRRRRVAIDGTVGRVVLVQIAGIVARRMTSWRRKSDTVSAGERLGLIHFGSRADVLAPRDRIDVAVGRGQRVRAGVSVLARYRREEP